MSSYPSVSSDYQDALVGQSSSPVLLSSFPLPAGSSMVPGLGKALGGLATSGVPPPLGVESKKDAAATAHVNTQCGGKCFVEAGWRAGIDDGGSLARCPAGYARSQALGVGRRRESMSTWVPEQFQFNEAVSIHQGLTAKSCRLRLEQAALRNEAHEGAWQWRDQGGISSQGKQPQVLHVHGLAAGADLYREIFAGWVGVLGDDG